MERSKWTRRALIASGTLVVIGGAAAALKSGSGPGMNFSYADAGTLIRGNGAEPDTLDPQKASATWENNIIGGMFIALITDAPDCEAIPAMADSFRISPDSLAYPIKLRDHILSHRTPA